MAASRDALFAEALAQLASSNPGIVACALVDGESGLVLQSAGRQWPTATWEAAIDFWRLHRRHEVHFSELGFLGAVVLHHQSGLVVLLPFGPQEEYLLACISGHKGVDWRAWQASVRELGRRLNIGAAAE